MNPARTDTGRLEFVLVRTGSDVSWFERRGDRIRGYDDAWHRITPVRKVLEVVHAADFKDLDYTRTTLGTHEGYRDGWLSPTGEWFSCPPEKHIALAYLVIGKPDWQLDNHGWCKVRDGEALTRIDGREHTPEQAALINRHLDGRVCELGW